MTHEKYAKNAQNMDQQVNQQQNTQCIEQQIDASAKKITPALLPMLETFRRSAWIAFTWSSREGSTGMNNVFGLPLTFATWDNKVITTQRPFWEDQSAESFKIMT